MYDGELTSSKIEQEISECIQRHDNYDGSYHKQMPSGKVPWDPSPTSGGPIELS